MSEESPWHAHAAGLWSILKTRGKEALHTERGRNIFWPTYSLVVCHFLFSCSFYTPFMPSLNVCATFMT